FNPEGEMVNTLRALLSAPVLVLLLIMTLKSIQTATEVRKDVLFAALSGYILIGYIGGFLTIAISLLYPGSYNITERIDMLEALYFSFVTMTTLGYGDLLPLTQEARALSILLCIVGPMYVAILVAMIVGTYASKSKSNANQSSYGD
ncbi:MAG: potassium channel family protein, partial [Bacteroidales bacterium]